MMIVHTHLRLTANFSSRTRERCPLVVFTMDGDEIASLPTDETNPVLPFDNDSIDELVIHDDALSRVIDEEVWLVELARVLSPGGVLKLTLPAAGPLAWLDAMNAYRYITDITHRGDEPDAALPTGWNRHYSDKHVRTLLDSAGLQVVKLSRQNYALNESRMLLGLLRENWIRGDRKAEHGLFPRFGKRDPRSHSSPIGGTWSITAKSR